MLTLLIFLSGCDEDTQSKIELRKAQANYLNQMALKQETSRDSLADCIALKQEQEKQYVPVPVAVPTYRVR